MARKFKIGDRLRLKESRGPIINVPNISQCAQKGAIAIVKSDEREATWEWGSMVVDIEWVRDKLSNDQGDGEYYVEGFELATPDTPLDPSKIRTTRDGRPVIIERVDKSDRPLVARVVIHGRESLTLSYLPNGLFHERDESGIDLVQS